MKKRGPKKGSTFKEPKPYSFGQRLYEIRKRKGLTQKQLAEKLGATVRAVSYYEREAKNPTLDQIEKIAAAIEVPKKVFLEDSTKSIEEIPETPTVIKSLRQVLPKLQNLPRKKQESLVVVINGLLSEQDKPEQHEDQ